MLFVDGTGNIKNYQWLPDFGLVCDTCQVTKASPQLTTTYKVITTGTNGCTAMDSVHIRIEGCDNIWIPNAFTPNGDGLNDVFMPKGKCMISYTMYIFDRWGSLIYSTNDSQPWNGRVHGNLVQEDTYIYMLVITDSYFKQHTYIGRVTVIE